MTVESITSEELRIKAKELGIKCSEFQTAAYRFEAC